MSLFIYFSICETYCTLSFNFVAIQNLSNSWTKEHLFEQEHRHEKIDYVYSTAPFKKSQQPQGIKPCELSALRLCVWRFNNSYMKLFYVDQTLAFAFWTKERKVF